ncbi:MAG: hypothetical protein PHT32_06520, partial [Candidatus Omnitrophica bacterium]|nr:hypothetical protein [Candidatus Omnitrophota bacterium]
MFIKNLSKREKTIAAFAVSMILAAVIYSFLVDPILSRWRTADDDIKSGAVMLEKDMKMLAAYKDIEADYRKYSKYVKSAKSEDESVAEVLTHIETISRNDSCLIVNIKPVGARNVGSYREVLVDVTAEATMENFSKFLYDIENSPNMILGVRRFTL